MREVYRAGSLHEAQMLVDLLADERIETFVRNEHLQGALGELPLTLQPIVCIIDDSKYLAARTIARDFELANRRDAGPDRLCGHCGETSPGNFSVCWKCRKEFAPTDVNEGE